ncbi:MAG: hypothetical protein WD313_03640 [Acidimicrobiia bacterium]
MAHYVTIRLDDEATRALSRLMAVGFDRSEAINKALVDAADHMSDRQALAAEVSALASDPDDRAEMIAVTDLMEILLKS